MRTKFKLLMSLFSLAIMLSYISCRKNDLSSKVEDSNNIEDKFFNLYRSSDKLEESLVGYISRQNSKLNFVEKTVRQIGYPRWNKISVLKHNSTSFTSSANPDTSIYYIPFARDSENFVNASMLIKISTNADTIFSYIQDWQYTGQQNTSTSINDNAELYAVFFMTLTKNVFGYNKFKITDPNLFKDGNKTAFSVTIDTSSINGSNNLLSQMQCTSTTISWNDCPYSICNGPGGSCDGCNECTSSVTWTYCQDSGSGGSTGGSGGNSGGSSGGSGSPSGGGGGGGPTGGGTSGGGSNNPLPNNTGWIPLIIIDDDVITLGFDSIPNMLSTLCSTKMDSLYQWGMANGFREQSFIIVVKDGIKYPKNIMPGFPTGDKTRVNYTLAPGEQLIAYVHTHAEDTVGYYRTSFSANDLIEFNKNANTLGYTALLEVGNARYAFVVEDVQKKNNFNIGKKGMHRQLFEALLITLSSTFSNGQTLTEQTWMQYLGSASISGIGFYKSSTKRGKNIFTKLNP